MQVTIVATIERGSPNSGDHQAVVPSDATINVLGGGDHAQWGTPLFLVVNLIIFSTPIRKYI